MAIKRGPNIIKDGLIFNVDAADINSYSPNVARYATDLYTWCGGAGLVRCNIYRDASITRKYGSVPLKMVPNSTDPYINSIGNSTWNLAQAAINQTWTASVYARSDTPTDVQIFIYGADSSGGVYTNADYSANTVTVGSSWTRFSITRTFTQATTSYVQVRLDGPNSSLKTVWFDGLQVEQSSSPTKFNPNYIGKYTWKNMTQSNNVVLINNPIFSTEKNGIISFDGNGAYLYQDSTISIPPTQGFTFSTWIKVPSSQINSGWNNLLTDKYSPIVGVTGGLHTGSYEVGIYSINNTSFLFKDNFASPNQISTPLTANTWTNIVFGVKPDYTPFIYKNGVLAASSTGLYGNNGININNLFSYENSDIYGFKSDCSNIQIYNRSLSSDEILHNYNTLKSRFIL